MGTSLTEKSSSMSDEPLARTPDEPPPARSALPEPIPLAERVSALDTLRGVAVLGILLMNIVNFGLPDAAEDNPTLAGGATGLNLAFWFVNYVLFEGKMRAIFSMLFGAGVIILTSRAEKRDPTKVADIYYRRTLWLIVIGALHALFLWDGDILFTYGTAGLVLYPVRRLPPPLLIGIGLLLLAAIGGRAAVEDGEIRSLRHEAEAAKAAEENGRNLTPEQQEAKEDWDEKLKELRPTQADLDKEIGAHRASYWKLMKRRLREAVGTRTSHVYEPDFLDAAGMMLIGMGLVKLGILTGKRGRSFYAGMAILGYLVGVPLNTYVALRVAAEGFDPAGTFLLRHAAYDTGRLAVALGHIGLVMFLCQTGRMPRALGRLAAVGRMALSNYLLESVICTLIFDGYGLGLYARLGRAELLFVVFMVWASILAISPIWLRHFRFGPVEWVWRSLTYWQRQPMLVDTRARAS